MRWFHISGTATRRQVICVAALTAALVVAVVLLRQSDTLWPWARPLAVVAGLSFAALLATLIRRLHDIGRPGYWVLLTLLPWVGFVATAWLLVARPRSRKHEATLTGAISGAVLVGAVVLLSVSTLIWRTVQVTAGSMKPTLLVGDIALVRQGGADLLQRGDLALVRAPGSQAEHVVRLIGLAGDRVQMRDGVLWLNGAEVPRQPAGSFDEPYLPQGPFRGLPRCKTQVGLGGVCQSDRMIETLPGGRRHAVQNIEDRPGLPDNTPEVTVPEGALFFLGDARDNAMDSRFSAAAGGLGLLPVGNVAGRLDRVLLSSAGQGPGWLTELRPGRIMARPDRVESQ